MASILYLPIDWLGHLIPAFQSPLSGPGEWNQPWVLLERHMMIGVPTYVLIFYIPSGVRFLRARFSHRKERA
jgi:hypothetical protein